MDCNDFNRIILFQNLAIIVFIRILFYFFLSNIFNIHFINICFSVIGAIEERVKRRQTNCDKQRKKIVIHQCRIDL